MLGIESFWIWSAYLLCILSALLCLLYGITHWNKDGEEELRPEDEKWVEEEHEVEESL